MVSVVSVSPPPPSRSSPPPREEGEGGGRVDDDSNGNKESQQRQDQEPMMKEKIAGFIDIRDVLSSFLQELDLESLKDAKMLKRMRVLEEKGQAFSCKAIDELKSLGSDGWFYESASAQKASILEIITEGFLSMDNKKEASVPSSSQSGGAVGDDVVMATTTTTNVDENTSSSGSGMNDGSSLPQGRFGGTRKRHVVHRLALQGLDGRLTHIVSQSDVTKFLYDNLADFGNIGNETAADLGFVRGSEMVVKVSPECPALDAMVLMEEKDISAVAVVNAVGAIIGNFSISELRNIMSEHFGSLALPVGEFLALEHGTEYAGYAITKDGSPMAAANIPLGTSPGSRPSGAAFQFVLDREMRQKDAASPGHEVGQNLITCSPDAPLSEILSTIVHNRLHRIYVCSDDMVPCGVITLTDLLRKLSLFQEQPVM